MSMCVARPENASPQLPPSVSPTPCASGSSVQQGNAVRVTLGMAANGEGLWTYENRPQTKAPNKGTKGSVPDGVH